MGRMIAAVAGIIGLAAAGQIDAPRVPADIQFDLTLKILTFDRNLNTRVGTELVFGIVYDKDWPPSLQVMAEMTQAMETSPFKTVSKIPIRAVAINAGRGWTLANDLRDSETDVVYIAPLPDPVLAKLFAVCRDRKLTTVSSLPEYAKQGATIGFLPPGRKPIIVINLKTALAEGADFDSHLLGLAKVIR